MIVFRIGATLRGQRQVAHGPGRALLSREQPGSWPPQRAGPWQLVRCLLTQRVWCPLAVPAAGVLSQPVCSSSSLRQRWRCMS
jgi:hypothetical protein